MSNCKYKLCIDIIVLLTENEKRLHLIKSKPKIKSIDRALKLETN